MRLLAENLCRLPASKGVSLSLLNTGPVVLQGHLPSMTLAMSAPWALFFAVRLRFGPGALSEVYNCISSLVG